MKKFKPRIILFGGTHRAFITLKVLMKRKDINIVKLICMKGCNQYEAKYASLIKKTCKNNKIKFIIINKIKESLYKSIKIEKADLFLGIGIWRIILPEKFIRLAKYGYLCVHASPVPKYRGFAPIQWQIINGESEIILRAFKLDKGIDSGPLILDDQKKYVQDHINIKNNKHLPEIIKEYDKKHIRLTNKILNLVINHKIRFKKQNEKIATFYPRRSHKDSMILWNQTSQQIHNTIRALAHHTLGAYTFYNKKKIFIFKSRINKKYKSNIIMPGKIKKINNNTVIVGTTDYPLEILETNINKVKRIKPSKVFTDSRHLCY